MGKLYDEICSYENIKWSFDFIGKRNRQCGPDGISWEDILDIEQSYLCSLVEQLKLKTFTPNPDVIKQTNYPGSDKILYYTEMNIREKIVEYAIKRCIVPKFEELFMDFSCAYRKNKGKKYVTKLIQKYSELGNDWFISLDIKSFFGSINQTILLDHIYAIIDDGDVVELILKCLGLDRKLGIPAGHVLSPLLSNFYLYKVDNNLFENNLFVIRYADNYCFASNSKEELGYITDMFEHLISEYGLVLNNNKTKIVYCPINYTDLIV